MISLDFVYLLFLRPFKVKNSCVKLSNCPIFFLKNKQLVSSLFWLLFSFLQRCNNHKSPPGDVWFLHVVMQIKSRCLFVYLISFELLCLHAGSSFFSSLY